MSTILKALRRLEEDRDVPSDRSLREEVADPEVPQHIKRSGTSLVVAGILLVAFVLIGAGTYWLATSDSVSTNGTTAETAAASAPTSAGSIPSLPRSPAVVADSRPQQRELSPAALESLVSVVKRDPPQPRISASPEMEVNAVVASSGPRPGDDPIFLKSRQSASGLPGRHKGRVAIPVSARRFRNQTTPENTLEPDEPPLRQVASARPLRTVVEFVPASDDAADSIEASPPSVPASSSSVPSSSVPSNRTANVSQPTPEPEAAPEPTSRPEPVQSMPAPTTKQLASITPVTQSVPAEPEPSPKPAAGPEPTPPKTLAAVSSYSGPTLTVERTMWHPIAAKRFAVVIVGSSAAREVREGDEIGTAVVAKIEPSGVIFSEQGEEFRRRIGE